MTEQEAEVLAARLVKIWAPENTTWSIVPYLTGEGKECALHFHAQMPDSLYLKVDGWLGALCFRLDAKEEDHGLLLDGQDQSAPPPFPWVESPEETPVQREFMTQWLPVFRRGCRLSGCEVEATAHEKAEWMRGFSREEELEAWGLKM